MTAMCGICRTNAATCFGATHDGGGVFSCDACCGHGQEDGWCMAPVDALPFLYREFASMRVRMGVAESEAAALKAGDHQFPERYLSVYGAMVALQVRDCMREGRGGPQPEDMRRFVEEANAVAQESEAVQKWLTVEP